MSVYILLALIILLLFGIIFIVPVLANIQDISEDGLICGAFGICAPTPTEETKKFLDEKEKEQEFGENSLPPEDNRLLCDLSISVEADLIDDFGFLKIEINESNPSNYQWHCVFPSPAHWLGSLSSSQPLALFFEDEFIHTELVLIDIDNPGFRYDAQNEDYKSMFREIRLTDTSGFVDTPLNMDQDFYIKNVVHSDYILEIYYGRNINDLDAGDPLKDVVCEVGKGVNTKDLVCK